MASASGRRSTRPPWSRSSTAGIPPVAALLSLLFPRLGHVYARKIDTGLFFAVSFVLSPLSLFVLIGFVLVPAIWRYAIYDAAKVAERRDEELSRPGAGAAPY